MNETKRANDATQGTHPAAATHGGTDAGGEHGDAAHGSHAHGDALGPIDWRAWGAGLLGVAAGLAVAACFYISTSF